MWACATLASVRGSGAGVCVEWPQAQWGTGMLTPPRVRLVARSGGRSGPGLGHLREHCRLSLRPFVSEGIGPDILEASFHFSILEAPGLHILQRTPPFSTSSLSGTCGRCDKHPREVTS